MVTDPPAPSSDSELIRALAVLMNPKSRGLLVLGAPLSGKTYLLESLCDALPDKDCTPVLLHSRELETTGDLAERVLLKLSKKSELPELESTVVRSSAAHSIADAVAALNRVAGVLPAPILLVDAVDESHHPDEVNGVILDLIRSLSGWRFVVSCRPSPTVVGRLGEYLTPFHIQPHLAAAELRRSAIEDLKDLIDRPASLLTQRILARLALVGPQRVVDLTEALGCSAQELNHAMGGLTKHVVTWMPEGTLGIAHDTILQIVRERISHKAQVRISSLSFGSEEGEVDPLLNRVYIERPGIDGVGTEFAIVVGNRGSGKSAIQRRLLEGRVNLRVGSAQIAALEDPATALNRLVAKDEWANHEQLRTAWTLLIAAEVAARVDVARGSLFGKQREAVLAAVGRPVANGGRIRKWLGRLFGGTKIRFTVGPVDLVAELPHPLLGISSQPIDLKGFLSEANSILGREGRTILCLVDGIDEVSKYDRRRQEAAIQALFQAEHFLVPLSCVRPVIFIRSDLFELYDIQEKNKLVSRTLKLDWGRKDWRALLALRLLSNEDLGWMREVLDVERSSDVAAALTSLLAASVEGVPVERWLFESLRDGNGDISPRMAVLLLLKARNASSQDLCTDLPIFGEGVLQRAMTDVSELAFQELINDYKVAPTFVSNCRAGKIREFTRGDVEELFAQEEGSVSTQIRMLERLGFLERTIVRQNGTSETAFRVPPLFARGWEH